MALLVLSNVVADAGHPEHTDFEQAEGIINAEIPCDALSDEQLELLGDYYMEQMHPGEAHEFMDEMMGGEGSESLKNMHINMAKRLYCGEPGMMGFSNPRTNGGINMMGGYGMMSGVGWFGMSLLWLVYVAIAAFIFGIIFWWTKKIVFSEKKK